MHTELHGLYDFHKVFADKKVILIHLGYRRKIAHGFALIGKISIDLTKKHFPLDRNLSSKRLRITSSTEQIKSF